MELLASPEAWIAFVTLTTLEIVLGVDNIVFIAILAGRLPPEDRNSARQIGLAVALGTRLALLATLALTCLQNLKLTLETIDLLGYPRDKLKIVLNRSDSKVGLSLSEVEKTLRAPIVAQIPSSRDVPASTHRGVAIVSDDPKSPVSIAIRSFIDSFVVAPTNDEDIPPQMRTDRRSRRWRRNP